MTYRERLRLQFNVMRFALWERFLDLVNLFVPIFVVVGMTVAALKFWHWLFFA